MRSTQIILHDVRPAPAFTRRIREKCEKLERFHPNITHCRVDVGKPDNRGSAWLVTIRVGVPGGELVANHPHNADVHIAVREAFAAMRRQLKDAAAILRGEVRTPSKPASGGAP